MKYFFYILCITAMVACTTPEKSTEKAPDNPFLVGLNVPIAYATITADDIEAYGKYTLQQSVAGFDAIKKEQEPTFENVFVAMDDLMDKMKTTSNNSFMLYWVSPDSLTRVKGYASYQVLDSLSTGIYSDKELFQQMSKFKASEAYTQLTGHRKRLVDDMVRDFEHSGVNLKPEQLQKFKQLSKEITALTSSYSDNMNASSEVMVLDEAGADGLPENFKNTYKKGEGRYEVPVINATRGPVTSNAKNEAIRKGYYMKFYNRAADKNLAILDSLVLKRYELAQIMGYDSYAAYYLTQKMAKNPENVWKFVNDLIAMSKEKEAADAEILRARKRNDPAKKQTPDLQPWDISYYHNQLLKTDYQVDAEKIREYLPMEECLQGMFTIYQKLLGLEFKKVENASVWHEDVGMYEVYEGENLKGRFYLDLFPRPNKETWFYGVSIIAGKATPQGYEVPTSMLLGNFTKATETLPSLLSHGELNTLFHEFGHIVNGMSYDGEFSYQSDSKSDFGEAMSQIFENWIWDYETLSTFAKHYQTGETLSKETFDNMLRAKNVGSGMYAQGSLKRCVYDLNLYDKYNPEAPVNTDDLWRNIDAEFGGMPMYVPGSHPQASWIHINTHPVYYYGYLWSEVYAQDMFTLFEKNGLQYEETGIRYRKLILANGTQRDITEAVEEFLGRPSNNKAYIKSLGLD